MSLRVRERALPDFEDEMILRSGECIFREWFSSFACCECLLFLDRGRDTRDRERDVRDPEPDVRDREVRDRELDDRDRVRLLLHESMCASEQ